MCTLQSIKDIDNFSNESRTCKSCLEHGRAYRRKHPEKQYICLTQFQYPCKLGSLDRKIRLLYKINTLKLTKIANWMIGIGVHSDEISGAEILSTSFTTNHNKPLHYSGSCFPTVRKNETLARSFNWESHLAITRSAQEWRTTGRRLRALVHLLQSASGASLGPMALSLPFLETQREPRGTVFVCCTYRSHLTKGETLELVLIQHHFTERGCLVCHVSQATAACWQKLLTMAGTMHSYGSAIKLLEFPWTYFSRAPNTRLNMTSPCLQWK